MVLCQSVMLSCSLTTHCQLCYMCYMCQVIHESPTVTFVDLSRPSSVDVEDDGPVSVCDALVFLDYPLSALLYVLYVSDDS